jgi:hypothetical protein
MGRGPYADPQRRENASGRQTADLGPYPISSAVVSVWREEMPSVPQAQVRARKDALTPVRLLRANSLRIQWAILIQTSSTQTPIYRLLSSLRLHSPALVKKA